MKFKVCDLGPTSQIRCGAYDQQSDWSEDFTCKRVPLCSYIERECLSAQTAPTSAFCYSSEYASWKTTIQQIFFKFYFKFIFDFI